MSKEQEKGTGKDSNSVEQVSRAGETAGFPEKFELKSASQIVMEKLKAADRAAQEGKEKVKDAGGTEEEEKKAAQAGGELVLGVHKESGKVEEEIKKAEDSFRLSVDEVLEKRKKRNEMRPEFATAEDWEGLNRAIAVVGELQGSDKLYSPEELRASIDEARKMPVQALIDNITRAGGLRERVKQLLEAEKEAKKEPKEAAKELLSDKNKERLEEEGKKIRGELEKLPEDERKKIGLGLRNVGFFVQEWKSRRLAEVCGKIVSDKQPESIRSFLSSLAETYKKDEKSAREKIEKREESGSAGQRVQNVGYLVGNIMKYGRTVADVVGWTAGSPLRYAMAGGQFFSRVSEAAKEARLKNEKVREATRIKNEEEAADEAWKIYEMAISKSQTSKKGVRKEDLNRAYAENLPEDLLNRLKRSEPGTASGMLSRLGQTILRKDVEWAIKHGKFSESSFKKRLAEYDKMVGHYGTVDALAMGARYAESGGKAVVAGVQLESAYMLVKNLPAIAEKILGSGTGHAAAIVNPSEALKAHHENIGKILPGQEKIEHINELATVHKGEGIWHAVHRQLEARIHDDPKHFGLKPEDLSNKAKVHSVLNRETERLLVRQGYIKPDGTEIRISHAGEKVLLSPDNKITISGRAGEKLTYEFHSKVAMEHGATAHVETRSGVVHPTDTTLHPTPEAHPVGAPPDTRPMTGKSVNGHDVAAAHPEAKMGVVSAEAALHPTPEAHPIEAPLPESVAGGFVHESIEGHNKISEFSFHEGGYDVKAKIIVNMDKKGAGEIDCSGEEPPLWETMQRHLAHNWEDTLIKNTPPGTNSETLLASEREVTNGAGQLELWERLLKYLQVHNQGHTAAGNLLRDAIRSQIGKFGKKYPGVFSDKVEDYK